MALAVSSVGGILSPTAPDMGSKGILERYRQIQPRLIIAETSYLYAGKQNDMVPKLGEVAEDLHNYGLRRLVLVNGAGDTRAGVLSLRNA